MARVHGVYAGAAEVGGIPGGDMAFGGGELGWALGFDRFKLRALGGLGDVRRSDSLSGEAELSYSFETPKGVSATLRASSGWLDNWLAYSVRHSALAASLDLARDSDYAALGGELAYRNGGLTRRTELPLSLPNNRLGVAYAWWSHAFFSWFLGGAAVTFHDSERDLHQASRTLNGTLRYVDYPYPTPHSEVAFGALLEFHAGPAKLKTNFPVFSDGGYRAEDPYNANAIYYYRAHGMTLATFEASVDLPLGKSYKLSVGAHAVSRPYVPYAWFSDNAWNEYGLDLSLAYRTWVESGT
ncbi:MAG: hypothetical protein QM756_27355 [Polyangiaceae bacterium]